MQLLIGSANIPENLAHLTRRIFPSLPPRMRTRKNTAGLRDYKGLWRLLFVTEQGPEKVSFDNYKPLILVGKSINIRGRACTTNVFFVCTSIPGFCFYSIY